jgi:O-antigen/teichoic acid export membrane protein
VFTWIQQVSDRWALQTFSSASEVGQYAVLYQLGFTPIALLTGMAMSFLGPILYQRSGDATDPIRNAHVHQLAWRMTLGCLLITLLAFLITLVGHGWLFGVLVAAEFRTYSSLLPWMVLSGGIFAAGQMLALKLLSDMRSAHMTNAKIVTAVLGFVLNVAGAWLAGVQGVVGAMLVFSLAYLAWMAYLGRQWAREN